MGSPRPRRDPERGNSLVLALIVMSALATLGSLTVVSMQSSIQLSSNDRFQTIAMYAAESGAAVTMDFLRRNFVITSTGSTSWSNYVVPNNTPPLVNMSALIPSCDALPGTPNNLFDRDQNAWFHIDLLNNRDDPSFTVGGANDTDGKVIIRSTGHGPQGALAIIEWEVQRVGFWASPNPPQPVPASPNFALPTINYNPPSFPWDGWITTRWLNPPTVTDFKQVGVVLLGWRIVSL
ncbi:MAG TPA: hypothetical protein VF516_19380 [Kofleriaceae bacterium]